MSWGTAVLVVVVVLAVATAVSAALAPSVGRTRVVAGAVIPVLMPGERASAQFSRESVMRAFAAGGGELEPEGWLIEPIPGARGWWMRTQFRWFGWWFYRYVWPQPPHLEVSCGVGVEERR